MSGLHLEGKEDSKAASLVTTLGKRLRQPRVSTKPSENPDLRFSGTIKRSPGGTLTRSKMSLIAAVTAPGLVPVLITAPGEDESNARLLRKKTVIWSSHEHQSWNKAIQMITGYSDVAENLNFVLIEAFPAAEAAKLTALAPIQWKPEDSDPMDCPHHKDAVMPIIMVVCNHDLPICSWFLDSTPEMETIILAPNVAPTHRGDTLLSQTFQELSTADQTTFNVQGKVLGKSIPIEDILHPPPTPTPNKLFIRSFICSSIIDTLLHHNLITFLSRHFLLHPREGHHANPATVGGYPSRFQAVHATGASHVTINVS